MTGYRPQGEEAFPPLDHPPYRSARLRAPARPRIPLEHTLSEVTGPGPALGQSAEDDADLTTNAAAGGQEAIGERIIVAGRVLDEFGEPVHHTLLEVWQANAAGRYVHEKDEHPAPLDPNFRGTGRCVTDAEGRWRFTTIRPGAYPWGNHPNAWRPAHIHFSVFGPAFATRLVTQMYFPGDPLHELDPILSAIPVQHRHRLVADYDHDLTQEEWALGFRWDIVLRGPDATPLEPTGAGALS